MSLRSRIALVAAAAVAVAVVVASVGIYLATARTLHGSVDAALLELAQREIRLGPERSSFRGGPRLGPFGGAGGYVQLVAADGRVLPPPPERGGGLPVDEHTIAVARGEAPPFLRTIEIAGDPIRILTLPAGEGTALQLARPLTEVQQILGRLRRQLVLGGLLGIGLAAALGMVVARRAVRPVGDLTELAEEVATTRDLTRRLDLHRDDEIGRLAAAFDRMLAELEQARTAQQQLVADASHELRTPLTSLRTNIEVLAHVERLQPDERQRLVDDVVLQLEEFSALVGALVELSRGERPAAPVAPVRLDEVAERIAARYRVGGLDVRVDAEPVELDGEEDRLERCLTNLLDNARKYAAGGPIDVVVRPGAIVVRDHGPGIDPEDVPRIFDRFYRAPRARSEPGSGLGLAIVRQIVAAHGGTVEATNAEGGGARFVLLLPGARRVDQPIVSPR